MFVMQDRPTRLCDGIPRRELLRIGGLGVAGLSLPGLLAARETAPLGVLPTDKTFGRAKNIIFLYLAGGPPQHETFDPKPNAQQAIRGPFHPISTNIAGTHFCELLPRTARLADKLAIVRSMSTDDNTHSTSSYEVLTGYKYVGPNARTLQPTDFPYFGSIIKRYRPSDILPPMSTVWIPDVMRLNESVTPAGQTGGIMGGQWDPDRFVGDPSQPDYKVAGLRTGDTTPEELKRRQQLLAQVQSPFEALRRGADAQLFGQFQDQAFDLLTSGKAEAAFSLDNEPVSVRQRYGQNRWGQCVLLARRLIEAGVRLVHVQWPREPGDNAVDNPLWDTHAQNADRVEDVLCPQFDVGFSALLEDLDQRGLLEETLVVAVGEFGRTPKINGKAGRDHWGSVFSCALAGAGISGGQVYGTSDAQGGYPIEDRVRPRELTATMFHLLGLDSKSMFRDREGREHRVSEGEPLYKLLGTEPAARKLTKSTGDLARVPAFDPTITLMQTGFAGDTPVKPVNSPSRPKGWRGAPLIRDTAEAFGLKQVEGQLAMGLHGQHDVSLESTAFALLAQEVRSPFSGTYRMHVRLRGEAASEEIFTDVFRKHFRCRLQFFQFTGQTKNATLRKELAAVEFQPEYSSDFATVELTKAFINPNPGSNFSFGLGLGVAVLVEKVSNGALQFDSPQSPLARIRIESVELEFVGKQRNQKVKV